jgi:hypothetical protein
LAPVAFIALHREEEKTQIKKGSTHTGKEEETRQKRGTKARIKTGKQ